MASIIKSDNGVSSGITGIVQSADSSGQLALQTTTSSGTATTAVTIDSSGNVLIGATTQLATEKFRVEGSNSYTLVSRNMHNASGDTNIYLEMGGNTTNTSSYFINCSTTGVGGKFYVLGNGNAQNSNNSYGAISDQKLKENIVDATPKLADLCKVKIRQYNLKSDPNHKQIGVVAQELEEIFAGLVEETPDRDMEENDLGTTTKSVKYSVFVPMLIKAIQELNAKVETQATTIATLQNKIGA